MQHLTAHLRARTYNGTHRLAFLLFRPQRSYSQLPSNTSQPSGKNIPDVEQIHSIHEHNFARPTLATLDYFRRALKYTLIGFVTLAASTCTAFEAAHLWIEHVELAPDRDPENAKWGWSQEAERWSGGASGGTDPALGFKARHAIRSAWIAQHWGTGSTITRSNAIEGAKPGVSAVSAGLELAHDFLNIALTIAIARQQKESNSASDAVGGGKIRSQTISELLTRHASILERMGSRAFLFDSRSDLERVWAASGAKGVDSARVAAKLGDLCSRLGDQEEAVGWWSRASTLLKPAGTPATSLIPDVLPDSALAQRTLASIIPSISAHVVSSGDLRQAKQLELSGLSLLSKYTSHTTSGSKSSAAESLHQLYLAHRASLLSIHLAEVTFALKEDPASSIDRLKQAALSSERVANVLTGSPLIHPDAPLAANASSPPPPPPSSEKALQPGYASSRTLRRPASNLLRDARRSVVEAWTLAGILYEQQTKPSSASDALECYERALGWAGVGASDSLTGIGTPGEGTLEKDWNALWQRYVRVRDAVRAQRSDQHTTKA